MSIWILFFLSGLAGLIYEIVWVRELVLVFGATTFAIATVLTAFMGGLALGSHFFGRRADRLASPLRVYAFLEIGIGLYALAVHPLFSALIPVYRGLWSAFHLSFYPFSLLRFVLVTLILTFPTTCMGGTLPLLASHTARRGGPSPVGKIGGLYAVNTLGAVLGVLLCGFLFLPALGTLRTTVLVASINLAVGAAAFILSRRMDALSMSNSTKKSAPGKSRPYGAPGNRISAPGSVAQVPGGDGGADQRLRSPQGAGPPTAPARRIPFWSWQALPSPGTQRWFTKWLGLAF